MSMDSIIRGVSVGTGAEVNTSNELKIVQTNVISANNSSTTLLAAAGVFTGTGDDVTQYAEIRVQVFSNVAGSISIQSSTDNTNWDNTDVYSVSAATAKVITIGVTAQYFRVVYTNGGTIQTSFRLQTQYHKAQGRGSTQKPADARTQEIDCDEVIGYLQGFDNTSAFNLLRNTAKATQGAFGLATQDLKDAGRSQRTIYIDAFQIAATAETLLTASYSTDNAAVTTGASYSVTTAKRLRIQNITAALTTTTGNTTAVDAIVRIRVNNAGAAIITSPIQHIIPISGVAAVNAASPLVNIDFPDGWEFVAGAGIGITVACPGYVVTTAAPLLTVTIRAYEY